MRSSLLRQSLVVLVSGMSVASAQASTIDFNELASGGCLGAASTSITSDGFQFTGSGPVDAMTLCDDSSGYASNGSNFLSEIWNFSIIMTAVDASTFSLDSLDATRLHQGYVFDPTELRITGTLSGGGTVSATFALDDVADGVGGAADFESFILPSTFVDLTSVRFVGFNTTAGSGFGQSAYSALDNIVVNEAPVPEPGTLPLLGVGLAGMGARRWRQRRADERTVAGLR
jgi:hypothetical protein